MPAEASGRRSLDVIPCFREGGGTTEPRRQPVEPSVVSRGWYDRSGRNPATRKASGTVAEQGSAARFDESNRNGRALARVVPVLSRDEVRTRPSVRYSRSAHAEQA